MSDKKPTDAEIIKALECCQNQHGYDCDDCPYQENKHFDEEKGEFEIMPKGLSYDQYSCDMWLQIDTLDLINRQKAEIEKLEKVEHFADKTIEVLQKELKTAKAEAYKEFAERLHEELRIYGIKDKLNKSVFLNVVDKAKKELVGAEDERKN